MKILTLLGSPRIKGNTATVLNTIEMEFVAQGCAVERINVPKKKVNGCLGCNKCRLEPDRIACVQKDDVTEIFKKMISADLILFATPVYYWGMTAQLKALVDRTNALITNYGEPNQTSLIKNKPIALLATGGGVYENNILLFKEFDKIIKALLARKTGELHIGECLEPKDIPPEIKDKATKFAKEVLLQMATL
ncbi:flavodoxin family protein [Maridesulfovibrio sp.]|uniref:flavodoxin family protein n=1 Tax=Maridesulfovibrio sp. TaxID=2795000 RepID=UPI0039EE0EDB